MAHQTCQMSMTKDLVAVVVKAADADADADDV
jgi:hypothetical protein